MRSRHKQANAGASDEALMAGVRAGDSKKLGVLFERHHAGLFDFFSRLTGNGALSQDLVQEVFFRILKYRTSYREGGPFTAWMYRIARNVRADHFKKSRVEEPLAEDQADQIPESADASFWERLEQNLDRERLNALLERALLELPADKRELIVLSRYRQLPHVEVAAILEVDVGAVRVRLHRALRELETIFLKLAQESGENTLCNARNSKNTLPTI